MTAKVICIANHKGGVAKTSMTLALADAFARFGHDVLMIDMDPQANATYRAYSFDELPAMNIVRLFKGEAAIGEVIIQNTRIPGVHLIGSHLDLLPLEMQLTTDPYKAITLLRDKLEPAMDEYDVILVDTPPSLGFLTGNGMAAADCVLVPIETGSKMALMGTDDIVNTINKAKPMNPRLKTVAAVLTKHDARKRVCKLHAKSIPHKIPLVLDNYFPDTTIVEQGEMVGKTVLQVDPDHVASKELRGMAKQLIQLVGITKQGVQHGDQ